MRGVLLCVLAAACGARAGEEARGPRASGGSTAKARRELTISSHAGSSALVRERRDVKLSGSREEILWGDVAWGVDLASAHLTAIGRSDVRVMAQRWNGLAPGTFDILPAARDHRITVTNEDGKVSGVLRGWDWENLVLEMDDGSLRVVSRYDASIEAEVEDRDPGILWEVEGPAGETEMELLYSTYGLSWTAEYVIVLGDGAGHTADFSGWAAISNTTSVKFPDASLKLIEGPLVPPTQDTAPAPPTDPYSSYAPYGYDQYGNPLPPPEPPAPEPRYTYAIDEAVTVGEGTSQVPLFPALAGAESRRVLVYDPVGEEGIWKGVDVRTDQTYGASDSTVVEEHIEIGADAMAAIGRELPAGEIHVYGREDDGSLDFLGRDRIEHLEAGEPLRVKLGTSPDVVGERRQIEFAHYGPGRWMVEEVELILENRAASAREVVVLDRLTRGDTWSVTSYSGALPDKEDSRTLRFTVTLAANETKSVSYRVKYTWK